MMSKAYVALQRWLCWRASLKAMLHPPHCIGIVLLRAGETVPEYREGTAYA